MTQPNSTALPLRLDAAAVKERLRGRHAARGAPFPGPWTCIEEWRNIDLLAWSAWSSEGGYARVGYEVKVSRADLRSELLNPGKRQANVDWCNEFYLAVPRGLLTDEEMAYEEPEWEWADFRGSPCPGIAGGRCAPRHSKRKRHYVYVAKPSVSPWPQHEYVVCPRCNGKGTLDKSRVEREAPTCWVPRDIGLVVVDENGTRVLKKSPRRKAVPALEPHELGQLVRWVSMRPDPRHTWRHEVREEVAA